MIKEYELLRKFADVYNGTSLIDKFNEYGTTPETAFRMLKSIYLPKELNIKNIDGLNCNFKVNGAIPLNQLQNMR